MKKIFKSYNGVLIMVLVLTMVLLTTGLLFADGTNQTANNNQVKITTSSNAKQATNQKITSNKPATNNKITPNTQNCSGIYMNLQPTPTLVDPFESMKRMQENMNRLFSDEFMNFGVARPVVGFKSGTMLTSMRMNLRDAGKNLVITCDLPGMNKKDLSITIRNNILTVSGERKSNVEKKAKGYYFKEINSGLVQRSIKLPFKVDEKKAVATYKNGVLEITIPKLGKLEKEGTKINIK